MNQLVGTLHRAASSLAVSTRPRWRARAGARAQAGALVAAALALAPGPAAAQTVQQTQSHLPPFPPAPACTEWRGESRGNASMTVRLQLCEAGGRYSGLLQWEGEAGWNERAVEQVLDADAAADVLLRDARITREVPAPGWRFCTVDRYALTRSADGTVLAGRYDSAQCSDHGTIALRRVEGAPDAAAIAPAPSPPQPAVAPPVAPGPLPPRRRALFGCRCSAAPEAARARSHLGACALAVALIAHRSRRRRNAARRQAAAR